MGGITGGSAGKNENEANSSGSFDQRVWNDPMMKQFMQRINNQLTKGMQDIQPMMPGVSDQIAGIGDQMQAPWEQQMGGGAYADVNANDILKNLNASMQQPSQTGQLYGNIMGGEGNVFLGGMKDMLAQDSADRQAQALKGLDARAAASGMSGASTYRNELENIVSNESDRLADQQTGLGYNTFGSDLGMKLGIAEQADQNTLARQGMLQNMLAQKQGAMTGGLNFGQDMAGMRMGQFSPYMTRWQTMNQAGNLMGSPTILGSGNMSGSGSSKGMSAGLGK